MDDPQTAEAAKTEKRRRRSSKEVKEIIIRAAQEIFGESGFDGTTMREVARRSGIHEPTLYRHFPSKDALFDAAVFGRFDQQLIEAFQAHASGISPSPEGLIPVFDPMLAFMASDRRLVLAVFDRLLRPDAAEKGVTQRLAGQVEAMIDGVVPVLERFNKHRLLGGNGEGPAIAALMLSTAVGLAFMEPILKETKYSLAAEAMVRQMAHRQMGPSGMDVTGLSEEGSVKVIELINRVLEANRAAAQAQVELEHLARWGNACPQNGAGVSFGPQEIEAHLSAQAE